MNNIRKNTHGTNTLAFLLVSCVAAITLLIMWAHSAGCGDDDGGANCTPQCAGKCCGDDGCGDTCPDICTGGDTCNTQTCQCEGQCEPQCQDKCCGDDGCGDTCPDICTGGDTCNTQTCECEPPAFQWPDGEPGPGTLYFTPTCEGGYCANFNVDRRDSSTLTCMIQNNTLIISATLTDTGTFDLDFTAPTTSDHTLPTDGTSHLDWTTEDHSTWFAFFDDTSSGTVRFAACGSEIAGRFDLVDVVEPHTYGSLDQWEIDVTGAFKCTVTGGLLDCGL